MPLRSLVIACFLALLVLPLQAQKNKKYKPSKEEKKTMKTLKSHPWQTEYLELNGQYIDCNAQAGPIVMYFYDLKEKVQVKRGKKTKYKKQKVDKWKMDIGGRDRIFDFQVRKDSIQFLQVKGWNDMRIIKLEDGKLVVDQLHEGNLRRWYFVPAEEENIFMDN